MSLTKASVMTTDNETTRHYQPNEIKQACFYFSHLHCKKYNKKEE